jgi:hypothetical protein
MTAALDRVVANSMGLKSVNNCKKWGKAMIEENDDIQDYKKPWVGLTEADIENCIHKVEKNGINVFDLVRVIEAKLKEKNT